jgi:putative glycosyltransferase (TIGR04372 family)
MDRDIYNLFDKQEAHVRLSKAQYAQGQKQLQEMGIEGGARHVCLIVRDSAYLPELEYHRYRDSDIEDYAGAAQALAERGYYVIRMGAKVEKPMPTGNPRIIDYATLGLRTEFMDVFLGATCTFCISTGCGFDAIPYVFRRPICYVNYVPVEYLFTFARYSVAIWKHHLRSDGRRMTMPEIIASGAGHFMTADEFAEAGITLQSNSPAEIRDAVLEMADIAEGAATSGPSQAWFWDAFPRSRSKVTGMPLHGKIRMRIGARFLEQYTHPQEKAA